MRRIIVRKNPAMMIAAQESPNVVSRSDDLRCVVAFKVILSMQIEIVVVVACLGKSSGRVLYLSELKSELKSDNQR